MDIQKETIENFYTCFQNKDYKGMIECYHPDIHFKDEIFDLTGKKAGAMWHMLCENGKDLEISFDHISIDGNSGSASWEAKYTFSKTGRKVHNQIQAKFMFKDEKIIEHVDSFDFWNWSSQALGVTGKLFGWSKFLRNKVSTSANTSLKKFILNHSEYKY